MSVDIHWHACPAPADLGGGGDCPMKQSCGKHCRILLEFNTDLSAAEVDELVNEPCSHEDDAEAGAQ